MNCFTHYMFYVSRGPRDKASATVPVWTASGVIDWLLHRHRNAIFPATSRFAVVCATWHQRHNFLARNLKFAPQNLTFLPNMHTKFHYCSLTTAGAITTHLGIVFFGTPCSWKTAARRAAKFSVASIMYILRLRWNFEVRVRPGQVTRQCQLKCLHVHFGPRKHPQFLSNAFKTLHVVLAMTYNKL